ncbi:uracil-DNA glycosylase [Pseudooceanicola marinus]|uniref:uracil-DNA glycosylase n=1 Tax=Pseudooceanicola marinus TaxID=396013 RepID=UPI001CD5B72C|nr:uracil-DNA glycosylase [Pseudooceanicola marinus]MCA1337834.1 uracil-DNA glycosylase [Pseudooceanicola marinus]
MRPLNALVAALRNEGRGTVPDFDPLDGGSRARMLFLMEKPGPMTDDARQNGRIGSGFISRDNDDPTAEAIFRFMAQAGVVRQDSALWNAVPWWNGTRKITGAELSAGLERLGRLLDMLPELRVVVAVGGKAAKVAPLVAQRGLPLVRSAHPSPINRAARRKVWDKIPEQWSEARRFIAD